MTDRQEDLVPLFVPPLATLLADAARKKGDRLTEAEVTKIRDAAVVMMVKPAEVAPLEAQRGFRDVDPEDCWRDWHRLRVEMTGDGCLPRLVLCVVGGADLQKGTRRMLEDAGVEHEFHPPDARMVPAFDASRFGVSTLASIDLARVAAHRRVLYLLSPNFRAREAAQVSSELLEVARKVLAAGGEAIKCESSGIAHGKTLPDSPVRALVQMPIGDRADLYSCGMHLLGHPDLVIARTAVEQVFAGAEPAGAVAGLFVAFAEWLTGECPPGDMRSGHTFRTAAEAPRFRLSWEECRGYAEDDLFFNPFGRWRFVPIG